MDVSITTSYGWNIVGEVFKTKIHRNWHGFAFGFAVDLHTNEKSTNHRRICIEWKIEPLQFHHNYEWTTANIGCDHSFLYYRFNLWWNDPRESYLSTFNSVWIIAYLHTVHWFNAHSTRHSVYGTHFRSWSRFKTYWESMVDSSKCVHNLSLKSQKTFISFCTLRSFQHYKSKKKVFLFIKIHKQQLSAQSKHISSEIKQQQRIMDSNRMNFNGLLY